MEVSIELLSVLVLLFLIGSGVALAFLRLFTHLQYLEGRLNDAGSVVDIPFSLDDVKDSMIDIVEDTLKNMNPPSAFDHIAGAVAQMIQAKTMKSMGLGALPPAVADIVEEFIPES
jgi:hypothetical protein